MKETHPSRVNLFENLPADHGAEHFDTLVKMDGGKVERIVTFGQCSPKGFWYDQDHDEWVLVLRGHAKLEIEGVPEPVELKPGDYVNLSTHTRHRVIWTAPDEPTIWLAIHY